MARAWIPAKAVRLVNGGRAIQVIVPRKKNPAGAAYRDSEGRLRIVRQDPYWDDHWIDPEKLKKKKAKKAKKATKKAVAKKPAAKKKVAKKRAKARKK